MDTDLGLSQPEIGPPGLQPKPFGAWATIGLGAVIFIVYSLVQGITLFAVSIFSLISQPGISGMTAQQIVQNIANNGLALSISIIISAPIGILLIWAFIRMRKGFSFNEYLGLRRLRTRTFFTLLAIPIGLVVLVELIDMFIVKNNNPGSMVDAYRNSTWPVLFWIATIIFAPLFEEALFRGFALNGLSRSKIGPAGAVILTAVVWALLHIQYDWFGISTILIIGIILGIVKIKTGSLWGTILIHSTWNLLQMIGIVIYVSGAIK